MEKVTDISPKLMIRGKVNIPERFWDYVTVFDDKQFQDLLEKGFYVSNQIQTNGKLQNNIR